MMITIRQLSWTPPMHSPTMAGETYIVVLGNAKRPSMITIRQLSWTPPLRMPTTDVEMYILI